MDTSKSMTVFVALHVCFCLTYTCLPQTIYWGAAAVARACHHSLHPKQTQSASACRLEARCSRGKGDVRDPLLKPFLFCLVFHFSNVYLCLDFFRHRSLTIAAASEGGTCCFRRLEEVRRHSQSCQHPDSQRGRLCLCTGRPSRRRSNPS